VTIRRLTPYPFGALARRMFRELDRAQAIFDLPARRFVLGNAQRDLGVRFHGPAGSVALKICVFCPRMFAKM